MVTLRTVHRIALALVGALGCARAARRVGFPPVTMVREDPVAVARSVAAAAVANRRRDAEERVRCDDARATIAAELTSALGEHAGLPPPVRDALARFDPLVLVGQASADWEHEWATLGSLLARWYPPGYGAHPGERAHLLSELLQHTLLVRDREWVHALELQIELEQCARAIPGCSGCAYAEREQWRRRADGSSLPRVVSQLAAMPGADRVPRMALFFAWAQPDGQRLVALDAIASQREPSSLPRAALLLGASECLHHGDADGATLRLRRARALRAPTDPPDPALDLLTGITLVLAHGDRAEARGALERAMGAQPVGAIRDAASGLLATLAP